jgi:hypothetical protein
VGSDAPPARKGFQLAIRTGVAIPMGSLAKGADLSDAFSPQVPITVDIGGKIIPELFLGGYAGLAIGGAGGAASDVCDRYDLSCTAVGLRIGLQIQYHIIPDGKANPWIGYGIGYEATSLSGSGHGNDISETVGGVELAHFMAGVDFRVNRTFGIGPFADLSLGKYTQYDNDNVNGDSNIPSDQRKLHEWLTIGVKFTFFP